MVLYQYIHSNTIAIRRIIHSFIFTSWSSDTCKGASSICIIDMPHQSQQWNTKRDLQVPISGGVDDLRASWYYYHGNLPGNYLVGLGPNDSRIGLKFFVSCIVLHLIHSSMWMEGMYFHPIRQECDRTNRTNQTIDDHFRMRFTFCQHGMRANSVWANVKSHKRVFTVLFSPRIGPTPDSLPQPKLNLAHLRSSPIPSL